MISGCLLAGLMAAPLGADPVPVSPPPAEALSTPLDALPAAGSAATDKPRPPPAKEQLTEVVVQTTEPKFVAPTRRDRIGRIWAPVLIDGKGPYRMVLDTGATRSAITARAAQTLGIPPSPQSTTLVSGFTGSAMVPTIHVDHMEVGELYLGATNLPILSDVFGGAQGVLGMEGLRDKRIFADFTHDKLVISRSHGERARGDFNVVPLRVIRNGLLVADVHVGTVRAQAIIDTGAQGTVGNMMLQKALMRRVPRNTAHEDIIGVTLDVQGGDSMMMPDIDFGHLTVRGVHVTFGDMYVFQHWNLTESPTLTLGMDLLGSFDVLVIDYARQEMQIRLRTQPLR
jgi:hypothetical protein